MLCYPPSKGLIDIFYLNFVFYQSQYDIEDGFLWYLQYNNDSKWMDYKKILIYREKNFLQSLYSINWNLLDAFVGPFLVLKTSFTLVVTRKTIEKIIEPYLWKRVFQIRYRRQRLYENFRKGQRENYFKANKFWTPFCVFKMSENFNGSAVLL